jgi:hypothetical protein
MPLLNTGTITASFHAAGKYSWVRLKLHMFLRIGIKIPEQPFMIKPGILSSPTDLEGPHRKWGQGIKFQKIAREGKSPYSGCYYKQIESALRKHQQLHWAELSVYHQHVAEWNRIYYIF